MIVSGSFCSSKSKKYLIKKGWIFNPCGLRYVQRLPLDQFRVDTKCNNARTKDGIWVNIECSATVHIKHEKKEDIDQAAEYYLGMGRGSMQSRVSNALEGSIHTAVARLYHKELQYDKSVHETIVKVAETDMEVLAFVITSFGVTKVTPLEAPNKPMEGDKFSDHTGVLYKENKAAELKFLETAPTKLLHAERQVQMAQMDVILREKQLEAEVILPARAEAYRIEQEAEANKTKRILTAQAKAALDQLKGMAEADGFRKQGMAKAEAMGDRAEALESFGHQAKSVKLQSKLPELAQVCCAVLKRVEEVTIDLDNDAVCCPAMECQSRPSKPAKSSLLDPCPRSSKNK